MEFKTADLCDKFCDELQVAEPLLRNFGGITTFAGKIVTINTFEDNNLIRETLETPGENQVLVVDGGGSTRRALLGDRLAQLALDNDWSGIVIHGSIRDVVEVAKVAIGVRALAAIPVAGEQRDIGSRDTPLHFAGVTFRPGHYLYADADGIVVAARNLFEK